MLRRVSCRAYSSLQQRQQQRHWPAAISRSYAAAATSREKRALNKEQIKGDGGGAGATSSGSAAAAASPPPAASSSSSSGGGGGGTLLAVAALIGGGGALAYYNGLIPGMEAPAPKVDEEKAASKEEKEKQKPAGAKDESTSSTTVEETKEESSKSDAGASTSPNGSAGPAEDAEVVDQGELTPEAEEPIAPQAEVAVKASVPNVVEQKSLNEEKIMAELKSIKTQLSIESDKALSEAHQELAKVSSLNMDSLDSMTETQLKVRLVQMAKEMEDQSKWEAVRLQEFLAMKEKEVEDRYVLLIKKLRLEAENLMEERLYEQKKILTKQAEEALQEQQSASDAFVESSLKIQEQSFNEERTAFEKKVEEAMSAKYEELFGKSLAKVKEEFASKMDKKVKQIESLSKKLSDLETSLKSSKDFQAGSVQAHRVTAAAIALTDKLESGGPAAFAIDALKAAATDNAVVSSAVNSLPSSVATNGVKTVQELQTSFEEEIYPQCRRAVNVPDGQNGLEGQILGMVFAKLKYPPAPDDPAPESEKDAADYVLARARRHVQLGELEEAVVEMDKLKGQAYFTATDWENCVKDRVAVEKALKVIRMECALANESLAQTSA